MTEVLRNNPFENLVNPVHRKDGIIKKITQTKKLDGIDPLDLIPKRMVPELKFQIKTPKIRQRVIIPEPEVYDEHLIPLGIQNKIQTGHKALEELFTRKARYYENLRKVEQVYPTAFIHLHVEFKCKDKVLYHLDIEGPPYAENESFRFSIFEVHDEYGNIIRHPQIAAHEDGNWWNEYMRAMFYSIPRYEGGGRPGYYENIPPKLMEIDHTKSGTQHYDYTDRVVSKKHINYFQFQEFNLKHLLSEVVSETELPDNLKNALVDDNLPEIIDWLDRRRKEIMQAYYNSPEYKKKLKQHQSFNLYYNLVMNEGAMRRCVHKKKRLYEYYSIIQVPNGGLIAEITKLIKHIKETGEEKIKNITIKYFNGKETVIDANIDGNGRLKTKLATRCNRNSNFSYGYKVANTVDGKKCIIKLQIPKSARVATSGCQETKLRTNLCTPVKIIGYTYENGQVILDWDHPLTEAYSCVKMNGFKYELNNEIFIKDFDYRAELVCVEGIHFHFSAEESLQWHRLTGIDEIDMTSLESLKEYYPENDAEEVKVEMPITEDRSTSFPSKIEASSTDSGISLKIEDDSETETISA